MRIITGKTEIDFSVTPSGQFMQTITKGNVKIMKTTPFVSRFLTWLTSVEAEAEKEREAMKGAPVKYEYEYTCSCCRHGFDSDHGYLMGGFYICNPCRDDYEHFEFLRSQGYTDREIYDLIETEL